MLDFNKLVSSITGSGVGAGLAGGVAGGALVSALGSKSGRNTAKSIAKIGGVAAVGALAWSAYKKYQGNSSDNTDTIQAPAMANQPSAISSAPVWQSLPQKEFDALAGNLSESHGLLILRTMIAAAMADGNLGPEEQKQIFENLDTLGLTPQERAMLFDELRAPHTSHALAAQATDPVLAIEVYTAAAMMLDISCLAGREFLGQLSSGLNLPDSLVDSIDSKTSSQKLLVG
ncbi:MAG: uncharacterized membrane protein YebE (DUF533 family) [Halioglobus sp.]|jgi:uncharacterized membrane protein YebE (DUF533 family)